MAKSRMGPDVRRVGEVEACGVEVNVWTVTATAVTYVRQIAFSGVPVQIWRSIKTR